MTWIGIDDTDSPNGGCTTHAMTEVIRTAGAAGYDLVGYPRLVRLNPNIPYKTRGNAALAARFGHGRGAARTLGGFGDRPIRAYPTARPLSRAEVEDLVERVWRTTLACSRTGDPGTDPALVATSRQLPARWYWNAVRSVVDPATVSRELVQLGATFRTSGSDRGLVGASAAVAWSGAHPTWELLGYRDPGRTDRTRDVKVDSIRRVESRYPELFLCTDWATRRVLAIPHTPCPILFGLRATRPGRLIRAAAEVRGEQPERWVIYQTNQGTGDHLHRRAPESLGPFESAVFDGQVRSPPEVRRGGHAHVELQTRNGTVVRCIAFEPTKTLPRVVARLAPGDRLRVWGGRGVDPVFRLEGLEILSTVPRFRPGANPRCPSCARATSSLGRGRGFRCPVGHTSLPPESRATNPSREGAPRVGRYHPTPSARRHLHPRGPEGARGSELPVSRWLTRP